MKTPILALAIITIVAACSRSPVKPDGIELVLNGDVEEGFVKPDHWLYTFHANNLYVHRWEDEECHSTSHSLKTSLETVEDSSDFAFWYQRIPITPGTHAGRSLKLSCYIKLVEVTGQSVCLVIRADKPSGGIANFATTQYTRRIRGTRDWDSYSVTLENLSAEADEIMVYLLMAPETTGAVYFDDISLEVRN